jgi:hypothetical protein
VGFQDRSRRPRKRHRRRQAGSGSADLWVLFYNNYNNANDTYTFCAIACVAGPSSTPDLNTWVHLAATEDGTTTKLYRNGVLVASSPAHSGFLSSDITRVCIGGAANDATFACNSEFVNAKLDDVRIYARALTAAQIQSDMNTPVGGVADASAPSVTITTPPDGSTVAGANVSIAANASDNVGVVGVQFMLDGVVLNAEDTTAPYSTSWNTTATVNGSHTLTATARDATGNTRTSSTVTVTVNNVDATPPAIANVSAVATSSTTVVISWTTNEPASSQVEYGQTTSYGTFSALDPTLVTSHAIRAQRPEPVDDVQRAGPVARRCRQPGRFTECRLQHGYGDRSGRRVCLQ